MSRYSDREPYLDPVSGVLKNRLGSQDQAILEAAEADFVAARARNLVRAPLKGRFDLPHLQAIHRYMFGDLYEWAGQLRTVDISKGDNPFAHHAHIATAAATVFEKLERERHLVGLDSQSFCSRAAFYFGEINALHPVREGNGRTQREFFSHLANARGYYIAWEYVNQTEMLRASIESFHGDFAQLTAILRRIIQEP